MIPPPRAGSRFAGLAGLLAVLAVAGAPAAWAETVVERAARTGVINVAGRTDVIPMSYVDDQQKLVGFSIDIADRIAEEVSRYLGKPVAVLYQPVNDADVLLSRIQSGAVDLACGSQFTWEREMKTDFTIPFALSGIRLLTRAGGIDGSPESLSGRRIGVLADSLGSRTIEQVQPQARRVPFSDVASAVDALVAGRVDALAGDSVALGGSIQRHGPENYRLVPAQSYVRFAVGCMLPENDATIRNLSNLAIARVLQGYLEGEPTATALVGRWVGPEGVVAIPEEMIRAYFEMVLLNNEKLRTPVAETAPNP
jgi:polar amino acid transport system substrate-binding protein